MIAVFSDFKLSFKWHDVDMVDHFKSIADKSSFWAKSNRDQ